MQDPKIRQELVRMAARFHELANSVNVADFGSILQSYNDAQMTPPVQQQQQIQPKKDDEG